jgi:hypothetical protein
MRLRAAGLVLALAAITFKAFLPPGFMIGEQDGRAGVVLCSIGAASTATLDLSRDQHNPSQQQDSAGQHCPFAVAGAAAFAPALIDVASPSEPIGFVVAAAPRVERPHATHIGPPLPARGPPLQA